MSSRSYKPALSFFFCLIALFLLTPGSADGRQRLKIIIDASKDGGLWWFPQSKDFDADQPHQGKRFADSLRQGGAEVIELPRGEVITAAKLREADVVIRIPIFFRYTTEETLAYQQSVAAGTRLLLIGGSYFDPVSEVFGLHFENRTRFSSVKAWVRHPFSEKVAEAPEMSWTRILTAPSEAVFLAWLDRTSHSPVVGYLSYGSGYVVFIGQSLISQPSDLAFASNLIKALVSYSQRDLDQVPFSDIIVTKPPPGTPPELLEPLTNAMLPQPGRGQWRFVWGEIKDAKKYEIVVLGRAALTPLILTETKVPELTLGKAGPVEPSENSGYIADHNLQGWSWRVRAQFRNGSWGPWSKIRQFNVIPR